MRERRFLRVVSVISVALAAGCADKPSAPHKGEAAAAVRAADGGASVTANTSAELDAGVDDSALPAPAGNDELAARMRHLLEAITQNDADLASDALFPRDAFIASSDASDPQATWERKLSNGFKRSVERTHKRTKGIANAKFVGFELGHTIVQLTPKRHDFKKPLWRVKHSKIELSIDGKTRHIDIAEMTAWRGAWYVTRLR